MKNNTKFYICEHCGNLVEMINDSGAKIVCCGEKMKKIEANTVDASREKHVPEVVRDGDTVEVTVGSVLHPMTEEHSILWVYLETSNGVQRKHLEPGDAPKVTFALRGEEPVAVYAYCNLHGLWKKELN